LDFLLSPRSLSSSPIPSDVSHKTLTKTLTGVTFTQNTLADPFSPTSALLPLKESSPRLHIPTSSLFRSIGYKSEPMPGFDELGISFDERRGIIENDGLGRILPSGNKSANSNHLPGFYCTGWVKRGPTGVIASTMSDAFATAESIATDWDEGRPFLKTSGEGWRGFAVDAQKLGIKVEPVDWRKWERIDRVERARGEQEGRVRDKLGRVSEMLAVASA
jgi:adrenodoxin-NADP+ reductase